MQLKLDLTVAFRESRAQAQETVTPPQPSSFFPVPNQQIANELLLANAAADMLRMSDDSKLKMLYQIGCEHQLSTAFLPNYTEERPTKALSVLLKEYVFKNSAKQVNKVFVELGILEVQSRPSTSQGVKYFKCLTEKGLEYGKNLVSPHNQRETQPHYYVDTFPKLLDKINAYLRGETVMGGAA